MRCRGEAEVSDPTVETNCALIIFPLRPRATAGSPRALPRQAG